MPLTNGEGPIGLIVCPSRELARQVSSLHAARVDASSAKLLTTMKMQLRRLLLSFDGTAAHCLAGSPAPSYAVIDALSANLFYVLLCTPCSAECAATSTQTYEGVIGYIEALKAETEMPSRELRTLLAIGALVSCGLAIHRTLVRHTKLISCPYLRMPPKIKLATDTCTCKRPHVACT